MDAEDAVFRLAKPKRKGLLSLLFSRFLLIALLIVLQLAIAISVFFWLREYVRWISLLQGLFTLAMVIYLFNTDMDFSAKLTWMFLISLFPLSGAALLSFTQNNVGHRVIAWRTAALIEETKTAIPQPSEVSAALARDGSGTDDLDRYLCRSGCFPVWDRTAVTYYPSGEEKFQAVLAELEKAEHFIFLEYFIIEEGYMWGEILRILLDKAQQGVEVRVLYDGMGEVNKLPYGYTKLLRERGIRAKAFSPIRPMVSSHYNYRDHRKILVIDGKVAFTGGVNLADEYINRGSPFGHWKDAALRLEGPAVKSFTLMFLQMWNIDEKEAEFDRWLAFEAPAHPEAPGWVIPYGDCPLDGDKVGETVYMDILNRATDYVHIMTPYLILDGELKTALCYAAQRGVDVKLILPGIPDKKLAWALAKSHYRALLAAGVKIYEYSPGFVHAKVFVSDDTKGVVGTINLDYRSLYHHFECAAYLYKTPCIADLERDFQQTLAACREITEESVRQEKLLYRLLGSLMQFIAPLM